jgi:glucarate dehydratase
LKIVKGSVLVPERPGLGIELDMAQIELAHGRYKSMALGERDDAVAMQFLIPEWKFDPKRPSLVR